MTKQHLNRKEFLRVSSAAIVGGTLLPDIGKAKNLPASRTDVIVVGAGLSGLATARRLLQSGVDSVRVIEARNRVGGRTVNLPLANGHMAEGGGEWIGPSQTTIAKLAAELKIPTFDAWYEGDTTYDLNRRISTGFLPDITMRENYDFVRLAWKLDRMSRRLPRGLPWTAPEAKTWDSITLFQWLNTVEATPMSHNLFRLISRAIMAGYPQRISLLWFLYYMHSAQGFHHLLLNDGGAQDTRFEGGSQTVSIRMAAELGNRLQLDEPVVSINDSGEFVQVQTAKGMYETKRVVIAMMPADTDRIEYPAGMPQQRLDLVRGWSNLPRLPIVKISVVYPTPFWRKLGLNGAMQSDRSPLQLVFDNSPQDGAFGVLSCFMSIAEAPEFANRQQREKLVANELVRYFGPLAAKPTEYVEKDWATDPWSTGCITPLTPGLLSQSGPALRKPVGRIHWAGTETSDIWCGFMEGAVRSGYRAAHEVAEAMQS